ncbi:hypothetical protein Moror_1149 [Moniliophthora roreri MCA 2997]|uniref:F-box domain-containing protein n=1 Tax=Moniliophthora roreri (strain MCA 2997) TaxID=1381753 RepID=V2XEE3_MONRO|nr:hypothetical protein Moror_1149 [Moniliophthora roreri MCA 2997]
MTAITDFPLELINHIIDNLRYHKPSLASASLIAQTWNPRARYHLFRDIGKLPGNKQGYGYPRLNRFVELCTNEYSTIPNAGPRILRIVPLGSDALRHFSDALLKDNLAKKVFWNVEELSITCSNSDERMQFERLVNSGCFSQVKKLEMIGCSFITEGTPEMVTIILSFGCLEDLCLHGPLSSFMSPSVFGNRNECFSLSHFPKLLRRLTFLVSQWYSHDLTIPLWLFCGCSTLEEIVVDCLTSHHIKEIEYFLEHSTATIRQMTFLTGLGGFSSDDRERLKKMISASSSRVEDIVIRGYMDRLCYMFSGTAEVGNTPPRNLKKIILMPETWVREDHVQMFEAMVEKSVFFHGLEEIHLQLLVWLPRGAMDEAGWDEETRTVRVGSDPHQCGQKELTRSLGLFNEKGRTKRLLIPSVIYEIEY